MGQMGSDFTNRLRDGVPTSEFSDRWPLPSAEGAAEPVECHGCHGVFDPVELFDDHCADCFYEAEHEAWLADQGPEDPRDEYTFVRDQAL